MARSSTTFKTGHKRGGRPKGLPNKITMDQRAIFDEVISHDDRVMIVKSVFQKAMIANSKDTAPYCKLIFEYVFSRPKIGHKVAVLDMDEVFTTEVMDGVWREILAEARLRDAKNQNQPRLEVIDAASAQAKWQTDGIEGY